MSFLEIKDFRKDFGETKVLKGVDFSLEKGEVLAIIGSSGSGKTTLLRCMNFLETPDNGVMVVDGNTIMDINKSDYEIVKKNKGQSCNNNSIDVENNENINFDIDNICAQKDDCFECKNNVNNENLQKYGKNDEKMVKNNAFLSKIQARTDAKKLQRKIHKDFARKEKENLNNRLQFGLVFQSFNLFPHYNVGQNIFMPSELQNRRIVEDFKAEMIAQKEFDKQHINALVNAKKKELDDCSKENVDRLLAKVGLRDKKLSYPCELSGGQQQRVAIARALALSPNILCFDEPTSALDPELTGEVLKVIKGLKDNYMTMIVVTHEMDFAKNVADKVIFMQDGVIVEQGEPRQMFENPQSDGLKSFLQKSSESV